MVARPGGDAVGRVSALAWPPGPHPTAKAGGACRELGLSPGMGWAVCPSPAFRQVPRRNPAGAERARDMLLPWPVPPGPEACPVRPPPARPRLRSAPCQLPPWRRRAAARRAKGHREVHPPDPAARGRGSARRPRPVRSTEPTQGRPMRAGPPRRGMGRRRMVLCQPRRRLVPAPATILRRGPALPRRDAEFPLP